MRNIFHGTVRFAAVAIIAGAGFAQNPDSTKFYKLDFVVKEVEGTKTVNSRAYSAIAPVGKSNQPTSIRAGSKVRTPTGMDGQFTYLDVGVNIDCRSVEEVGGEVSLTISAEISSAPMEPGTNYSVIRQNKWTSGVVVPVRKPTLVFSSDDLTSRHQMQLELTATPVK